MSRPKIFIDGHAGTTGLRIREWLSSRDDLELWTLAESERKSEFARKKAIAESDLTVFCLPDEAAIQAAGWAEEAGARLIDASSIHRVSEGWVYGLPELDPNQRESIREARCVTNPGCYASAFVAMVRPLVDSEILTSTATLSIHGLSGYSGGGKSLIERWESADGKRQSLPFEAPYSLDRIHKHIPEMHRYSGLHHAPQFVPAVGPFRCGMRVEVPLHQCFLNGDSSAESAEKTGEQIHQTLANRYHDEPFLRVAAYRGFEPVDDFLLDPTSLNDTNRMELHVLPNRGGHVVLVALLDNLGKGASGVAIQSLNLMLGLGETTGLPA
jgi:N-acetyl-gamma-glutamyl-phosphate reductase